jgi:hypothetical protein
VGNQVLLWSTFIIPWMTLFFMSQKDIKRFLPAGFLVAILCIIFTEIGIANGWWIVRETTYPLAVIPTYTYGAFPVMAMWSLKYTFGRFGLFVVTEAVLNAVLAFVIYPWIASRGIKDFYGYGGLYIVFICASAVALIVYGYLVWQIGLLVPSAPNLQAAAAKPLPRDHDKNPDNV